jgi:hypothetical protein
VPLRVFDNRERSGTFSEDRAEAAGTVITYITDPWGTHEIIERAPLPGLRLDACAPARRAAFQ